MPDPTRIPVEPEDFGDGWEPNPMAWRVVTHYLMNRPEQGEWDYDDHWQGIAGGILHALHRNGFDLSAKGEPCDECGERGEHEADCETGATLTAALAAKDAELAKYREALERIAHGNVLHHADYLRDIAKAALSEENE